MARADELKQDAIYSAHVLAFGGGSQQPVSSHYPEYHGDEHGAEDYEDEYAYGYDYAEAYHNYEYAQVSASAVDEEVDNNEYGDYRRINSHSETLKQSLASALAGFDDTVAAARGEFDAEAQAGRHEAAERGIHFE